MTDKEANKKASKKTKSGAKQASATPQAARPAQQKAPKQTAAVRPAKDPRTAQVEAQNTAADEEDEEAQEEKERASRFLLFNALPSWLVSFLTHVALILLLALLAFDIPVPNIVSLEAGEVSTVEADAIDVNTDDLELTDPLNSEASEQSELTLEEETEPLTVDTEATTEFSSLLADETTTLDGSDSNVTESEVSNEVDGRGADAREQMLRKFGGTAGSESAVQLALQWIADHQLPDGSWDLDHQHGPVTGRQRTSPNPGIYTAENNKATPYGATALALLPFLGNGTTHRVGEHKDVVNRGLEFLKNNGRRRGNGLSYRDPGGTMYSHGLVAIVFCEAYAMTGDESLRPFAQGSLKFIEQAQNQVMGGWRYAAREPGDTSVVGWQIMALKSGKLSGLEAEPKTFKLTNKFLKSVSADSGAIYGYREKPRSVDKGHLAQTAVGLLCRMYMGWEKDTAPLSRGVQWMADIGPDVSPKSNMYYNYYATQVMKHYGGQTWEKWNSEMRDFLVTTQSKDGVEKGSWFFNPIGLSQEAGGRLYVTSLACMTLEVYYRYLPLYSEDAVADDFPLD